MVDGVYIMNREEHTIIGMLALGIILASGILDFVDGNKFIMLFSLAFAIFSTAISPDIDLKINGLAHRGITHSWKGLILIAVALGLIVYAALSYTSELQSAAVTWKYFFAIISGAVGAWFIHMTMDKIYDIFRGFTWLIVMGIVIVVYSII